MISYKNDFLAFMCGKNEPNEHEKHLLERAQKYIDKIKNIRGIKMIAICNSLSMFATTPKSDIDLLIVTEKSMIWYVRFFVTLTFWRMKVWRKNDDIAENFCLSFFVTENALNMQKIAIQDDIYLYFWVYFLKPILDFDNTYQKFVEENSWVQIDQKQQNENQIFCSIKGKSKHIFFWNRITNYIIRFFLKQKTLKSFEKMGRPKGVIISDNMLKFHDKDQRENIRANFGKKEKYEKGW